MIFTRFLSDSGLGLKERLIALGFIGFTNGTLLTKCRRIFVIHPTALSLLRVNIVGCLILIYLFSELFFFLSFLLKLGFDVILRNLQPLSQLRQDFFPNSVQARLARSKFYPNTHEEEFSPKISIFYTNADGGYSGVLNSIAESILPYFIRCSHSA